MSQINIKITDDFKPPPPRYRIDFTNSERKKLLSSLNGLTVTLSGNNKYGQCKIIPKRENIPIDNPINKGPKKLKPYRIAFAAYYGYLIKFKEQRKKNKQSTSHRCGNNNCIQAKHLLCECIKCNNHRRNHHKKLRQLRNRLARKEGSRGTYQKRYWLRLSEDECDCTPHCFISIGDT